MIFPRSRATKLEAPEDLLDTSFLRQLEQVRFKPRRAATGGVTGEHRSHRKAHSIDFADHRNYVPGDDFRLIDWNVYARLGELFLKLTDAEENIAIHLLIDCSSSMHWGSPNKVLYAQRVAAALGALALAGYDTVSLALFTDTLTTTTPPLHGRGAISTLLSYVHAVPPGGETSLAHAVASYCDAPSRRGIALLISDFLVPTGAEQALTYLARAGMQTTALHIIDSQEEHPSLSGDVVLQDCETGHNICLSITPALLRRYEHYLQQWCDDLAATCHAQRATYIRVPTSVPPQLLVLQTLRHEGLLW